MLGTAPYPPLQSKTVFRGVVEVVGMEAREPSWLPLMHAAVCKVHFFTTIYPAGYYLILVHLIHLYLDSFV